MANFNTHLTGAFAVSAVLSLTVYKAGLVNDSGFLICTALGTAGGLLPDLDSDHSTPVKFGFNIASLIVAFALVMHWRSQLSLVSLIVLWFIGYGVMRYLVLKWFKKVTVHRGVIHSVPYMAILGLLLTCLSYYGFKNEVVISWFYGLFLFMGALVHLTLDEMYSVNLSGMTLKRSAGTAMKFYQHKDNWRYGIIYALLALLLFAAPPFAPFWQTVANPKPWSQLKVGVLPDIIEDFLQGSEVI